MPLLRKGVLLPIQGADYSLPAAYINERSGFPKNVRIAKGEISKRPGKTVVGGQIPGGTQILGMGKLELNNGLNFAVRGSKTQVERYVPGTDVWTVLSTTGFTGEDEDFWSFTTVTEDGLLIATNGRDRVQKWDGSGDLSNLGGSPPLAKYSCYVSPYLLLAYVDDGVSVNPWRIDWCDTANPEKWTGGNSGSALLSNEASPIMSIGNHDDYIAGYKSESLWLGRKSETDIFQFEAIKTGVGLAAPRAWADAEGTHYFMGLNDFFAWKGAQVWPIGAAVRDEVFSTVNREKILRCFAMHVQVENEIWFFVVRSGNDWPTDIWKYNYRLGFWYYDTCDSLTAALKWERTDSRTWQDLTGSWDEQKIVWDSGIGVKDWEEILFGTSDGHTLKLDYSTTNDNGVAVTSEFMTGDFVGASLEGSERWLQVDLWARGYGNLYVDFSDDYGNSWNNIRYTSSQAYISLTGLTQKYELYFDHWAPHVRFRVRMNTSNGAFWFQSIFPYYIAREETRSYRA